MVIDPDCMFVSPLQIIVDEGAPVSQAPPPHTQWSNNGQMTLTKRWSNTGQSRVNQIIVDEGAPISQAPHPPTPWSNNGQMTLAKHR